MSTVNVAANLADHLAIRDLLDRYTNALNHRNWSMMQGLFTTDGVWDATSPVKDTPGYRFEGAANVVLGIAKLVSSAEMCIQSNHAVVIEVSGTAAAAVSTINEIVLMPQFPGLMACWGNYYDTLVRQSDGEWRFQERKFRVTWSDVNGPRGQVLRQFAATKAD
jgi:hypothetical protein